MRTKSPQNNQPTNHIKQTDKKTPQQTSRTTPQHQTTTNAHTRKQTETPQPTEQNKLAKKQTIPCKNVKTIAKVYKNIIRPQVRVTYLLTKKALSLTISLC